MSNIEDINKALSVPEKIAASDGREFYVKSWAPVVDWDKGPGLVTITAQLLVKVSGAWVTHKEPSE